ncbi:MAG: OmpA family protein [Aeromonas sp.]
MNRALKPLWVAMLMAAPLALQSGTASAEDGALWGSPSWGDWYGGVHAGAGIAHDISDLSSNVDKKAPVFSVFGGYNFSENFGAELGYLWSKDWHVANEPLRSQGLTLSALGTYPITSMFAAFAEGGAYVYNVDSPNGSDSDIAPLFGVGLRARLHDWVDAELRYRYLVRVGDDPSNADIGSGTDRWVSNISAYTLGLVLHPYRSSSVPAPVPAPAPMLEPPPVAAEPAPMPESFNLSSDVAFNFGQTSLTPAGEQALAALYQQLSASQAGAAQATVIGHTDRIGSDASNQTLSLARAQHVADYLVSQGLPAGQILVEGRGESMPVTGGQCDGIKANAELITCLGADRRVEILLNAAAAEPAAPQN